MAALPFGMVIVDESHNLRTTGSKTHDAMQTEACIAAVKRIKRYRRAASQRLTLH